MSAGWIAAGLALASVAAAVATGTILALLLERATRGRWFTERGARTRASLLAQARLAPDVLVLPVVVLVQLAFWRFEPAHTGEAVGPLLAVGAAAGAALLLMAAARVAVAWRATRLVRGAWRLSARALDVPAWRGRAYAVDSAFPVVAVAGVWGPTLYVAEQVVAACTAAEMAQMAAHEGAHAAARDNLVRVAFTATPMPPALAARLERRWAAASEEAADAVARAGGSGVVLAAALVKVAKLVLAPAPPPALVSAFIGADTLDGRVRRLLAPASAPGRSVWWVAGLVVTSGVTAALSVLHPLYRIAEFVVAFGR